jgi:hypothetical protein
VTENPRVVFAPGFPPRAAQLVRDGLAQCMARGLPLPPARLWLEAVPQDALGTAHGRCHEAVADRDGQPAIRIQLATAALGHRHRSRLRVPLGLHALWHEYAHALDQELRQRPDGDGVWGRFGRHTRREEWRQLFLAHRARRLPYLSPQARRGVEEFFAEVFVAYMGRPALLAGPGQQLVAALEMALFANDPGQPD